MLNKIILASKSKVRKNILDNNNILTVSNTGCEPEFTNKTLTVNVGVNIEINCN